MLVSNAVIFCGEQCSTKRLPNLLSMNKVLLTKNNVSTKYAYGFHNRKVSSIIVANRYLDYFIIAMEDRLWQVQGLAKPVPQWRNIALGLSINTVKAA